MKFRIGALSFTVAFLVFASVAFAGQTLYVDADAAGANNGSSWADAFNYLQDALAVTEYGDEIWVAGGTYKPDQGASQTPGDRTATFQLINGVALYGSFPPDGGSWQDRDPNSYQTILTGDLNGNDVEVADPEDLLDEPTRLENSYHVVTTVGTDNTSVLDGFTITGGNANNSHDRGGGMLNDHSNSTLTSCTFTKNSASGYGGGTHNYYSDPTLTNCTFTKNYADHGGGIDNWDSDSTLYDCTFIGNSAEYRGGGMSSWWYSNLILSNCTFSQNSAGVFGGGLSNADSNSTLANCTFRKNTASGGGGMYSSDSNSALTNCIFTANSGSTSGGMYNRRSNSTLINCIFTGNLSYPWGGGGMDNYDHSNSILTNCTFTGNYAQDSGSAISNGWYSNSMLTNCIVWENTTPDGSQIDNEDGSTTTFTYSDVQGGWPGENNIDSDPLFVNPGYWEDPCSTPDDPFDDVWFEGDYHLLPVSPCIDAGDNSVVEPNSTDLDGNPRIRGPIVDMGAYESPAVLFVDVDAPGDPAPGDPSTSDPLEDGSSEHPFDAIQEAIDASYDGDKIIVANGVYTGQGNVNIDFHGKAITVHSENGPANCIINCEDSYGNQGFYFHSDEDEDSVVEGFTIINGNVLKGGGIYCMGASPTISNCIITGNRAFVNGGGIYAMTGGLIKNCMVQGNYARGAGGGIFGSDMKVMNCLILENEARDAGGGIYSHSVSGGNLITNCTILNNKTSRSDKFGGGVHISCNHTRITNCIIRGNEADRGKQISMWTWSPPTAKLTISHTNLDEGISGIWYNSGCVIEWQGGNIDADPLFVEPGYWDPNGTPNDPNDDFWVEGDYHLQPGSPCIDAGDNSVVEPNSTDLAGNPRIIDGDEDGDAIVDMGAYEFLPSIEADVRVVPRVINRKSRGRYVMAVMRLPEGIAEEDIDEDEGFVLEPGNIESIRWRTAAYNEQVRVFVLFEKGRLINAVAETGEVELTVSGYLKSGQGIYGVDTIRIIGPPQEHPRGHTRPCPQRRAGGHVR